MTHSKGISWIDDCRITTSLDDIEISKNKRNKSSLGTIQNKWETESLKAIESTFDLTKGRFPANLLVCDDMLNDGNVIQYNKNRTDNGTYLGGHRKEYVGTDGNDVVKQIKGQFFNDKGTNSRYYDIDKWFDKIINYE